MRRWLHFLHFRLPLTLQFEKAGKIDLQVPIAKVGAMRAHDMGGM